MARSSTGLVLVLCALFAAPPGVRAQSAAPADTTLDPASALSRALESNPSFRAVLLDAVVARAGTDAATDARVPVFTASASGEYNEAIAGTASGAVRTRTRQINGSLGLSYTTAIGTVLTASMGTSTVWREVNRDPSTTQLFLIGPYYTAQASLSARQPLLRGAGADAVLAARRQAEAAEESAEYDMDDAASQLVVDVLTAYWELWYAEQALRVAEEGTALATRQLEEARARQRLGTIAPADVLQFATAEASLRESLVSARATRTARALTLAQLIGLDGPATSTLRVSDVTPEAQAPMALERALARLAERSPALLALRADVEAAEQRVIANRSAARARLDLTAGAGTTALFTDDMYAGLRLPGGRPAFNANVGVELELPVASNRARAELAAANGQLEAAEMRYSAALLALQVEIANRHTELTSALERIALVNATASVSSELAEAERARLRLGTSTALLLVQAQQTERESRLRVARTAADAVLAALRFEDGAGVLLDRFAITSYREAE